MSVRPPRESVLRTTELRLARLSVLQELTVAALELATPESSVDDFLQHVSERLGCVAALWLATSKSGEVVLRASAGLSRRSRELAVHCPADHEPSQVSMPYPELSSSELVRWALPLDVVGEERSCLFLFFSREMPAPQQGFDAMTRRLADVFQTAVSQRALNVDLRESYQALARTQKELVVRERLAALGEMAAAVAHEVRNPLGAIFNSLATLKKAVPADNGTASTVLEIVEEEAARLNRIITDLLDFAKPGGAQLESGPVDEVLSASIEAAHASGLLPDDVELVVEVSPRLPPVRLDGRLMRQALLNLLSNAIQATQPRGRIHLCAFERGAQGDRRVCIAVTDEGPGIEPDARDRIFQPFFTTKSAGTGLGLAIVKRVVEAHQGEVEVEEHDERGVTFTVALPVASD